MLRNVFVYKKLSVNYFEKRRCDLFVIKDRTKIQHEWKQKGIFQRNKGRSE